MKKIFPVFTVLILIGLAVASNIEWKSDLIFSHKFHQVEAEAECLSCHGAAETSTVGKDDLLPEMETCYDCHDEDDTDCAECHKLPDDPVILPRVETYSAKFNHKLHMEKDIACTVCHVGIAAKEEVESSMHMPNMDLCMTCHETPASLAGCYLCHQTNENLKPMDHEVGWMKNHGMIGEAGAENCKSCHTENYCIDCHQGENTMGQSHTPDFILTHGMSYLVRESDCASCHESKQYCVDCHMYANTVKPMDHAVSEWAGSGHAEAARTDYDRCSVCHQSDEALCATCHN